MITLDNFHMKKILAICLLALLLCSFTTTKKIEKSAYQVIPMPQSITMLNGKDFVLSKTTKISYAKGDSRQAQTALFLSEYIAAATGIRLEVTSQVIKTNAIILQNNYKTDNAEAYRLTVDKDRIVIDGASQEGIFYGVQTLRKVIAASGSVTQLEFPPVEIEDYPRFGYRGMMLDASRHFASVDFVKKYIDILALHNINKFHWHLTDDQGWRIEIKKYPKLTQIGSMRSQTKVGKSEEYDGIPHGGYYTQDEIKEIVEYARQRFITVIPEIDLPGHMMAALASYPELGCTGGPYEVYQKWGVSDDVLCIGDENTFKFLEDVFDELLPLFPSAYYHVGGDECPKRRWEKCPKCQAKIEALGLVKDEHHSAEEKLQSYCINRIEKYLNGKGKKIIGWDEILEGGLPPNATMMSWRSFDAAIKAAQQGHDAILTPCSHVYFDYYQGKDAQLEPLANGGYIPVELVYNFEPIPAILTENERKHIIGAQANLWREYIKTDEQVEYMVLPRLAALSEVLWTEADKKDYPRFRERLSDFLSVYTMLNYNHAKHILEVASEYSLDTDNSVLNVSLYTSDNAPIYYTIDGTEPTANSIRYTQPIGVKTPLTLKATAIRGNDKSKLFERTFAFNKASLKPIELKYEPAQRYYFNGAISLIDGKRGTEVFSTGDWLGFYNSDLDATIDLKSEQDVSEVIMGSYVSSNDWVFGPKRYQVFLSIDGVDFKEVYAQDIPMVQQGDGIRITDLKATFATQKARYVRVLATIYDRIPDWHYSAGQPTFLFVDEIIVN